MIAIDNQEITEEQLREATNKEAGYSEPGTEEVAIESEVQEKSEPIQEEVKEPEKEVEPKEPSVDLKNILDSTPYKGEDVVKSVTELAKGYKEIQGQFTSLSQEVKPLKSIIERATRDPDFREKLLLAEQILTNPAVAQQYAQPQTQQPDPRQFDLSDPQQYQAYNQMLSQYFNTLVDTKLSSRFAQTEVESKLERFKNEFRGKNPDIKEDLDQILDSFKAEGNRLNPYEVAWKLRNWDNREAQLTERLRKELTKKIETAQEHTPTAQAAEAKEKVNQYDVGKYISKYGLEAAKKKFTVQVVEMALRDLTNE